MVETYLIEAIYFRLDNPPENASVHLERQRDISVRPV